MAKDVERQIRRHCAGKGNWDMPDLRRNG